MVSNITMLYSKMSWRRLNDKGIKMANEESTQKDAYRTINSQEEISSVSSTSQYPSAEFLAEVCFQDYQRLQENYNKLYEKSNIALAFVGVVLTIMLGSLDFSGAFKIIGDLKVGQLLLILLEIICCICGVGLLIISAIRFLRLLKGKDVPVFNSVDIRNDEIYRNTNEVAAMWLIDKYTKVVYEIRPIVDKKQRTFDLTLSMTIIGIILYTISIVLQKGGF